MSRAQELLEKLNANQPEHIDEGLGKALKAGIKLGIIGYIAVKASKPVLGFVRAVGKPTVLAWSQKYDVPQDVINKLRSVGLTVDGLLPRGGF